MEFGIPDSPVDPLLFVRVSRQSVQVHLHVKCRLGLVAQQGQHLARNDGQAQRVGHHILHSVQLKRAEAQAGLAHAGRLGDEAALAVHLIGWRGNDQQDDQGLIEVIN